MRLMKQNNNLFAVDVAFPCGEISPDQLIALGELVKETGVFTTKVTTRQTMLVVMEENKAPLFREKLKEIGFKDGAGPVIKNIKVCAGNDDLCTTTINNVFKLGMPLYEKYVSLPTPKHFKIAIAGCPKGCTDPFCADLGIIASGKGCYDLFIGGKGGTIKPKHGKKVASDVPEDKVEAAMCFIFEAYKKEAQPKEKFCTTIERVGIEKFIPPQDL